MRNIRFEYTGLPRQTVWRSRGCLGCSPLVAGGVMIGAGLAFQTGWAEDVAVTLLKAFGYVLIALGAFVILGSIAAWVTGRRRFP